MRIVATGSYLPETVIGNLEICKSAHEADRIKRLTGVLSRRNADGNEAASHLAASAALKALSSGKTKSSELDLLVTSTTSCDMFFPSTACLVQDMIKAQNAAAFDISASCSGFLYGMKVAKGFIASGAANKVLLVAAEVKSRFLDSNDFNTYPLFGDGAGAVLLEKSDEHDLIPDIYIGADGGKHDLIKLEINRAALSKDPENNRPVIKMSGARLFRAAVLKLEEVVGIMLARNNISLSDIDYFIFHQANLRIIEAVRARLDISPEKSGITIERTGNTSSASIPVTLDIMISEKKIRKGDTVLLASFGGGLTWGGAIVKL